MACYHLTRCVTGQKRRYCVFLSKMSALHIKVGFFLLVELSHRATEHVSRGLWNHSDVAHTESGWVAYMHCGNIFKRLRLSKSQGKKA